MQASHLTSTTENGFAKRSLITLLALAFVCAVASAQVPSDELSEEDFSLIRQKATITTFGEKAVVYEFVSDDGQLRKVRLAGPFVSVHSLPGEAFQIDDMNSPSVGGVLGEDDIIFYGDLTLSSSEWDEQAPNHFQVHVYDGLVELTTVKISPSDPVNQVFHRPEVPLNQQGDFIRHMKERAKKRRNQ